MELAEKIELIVDVCHKCADILKDPTHGGSLQLDADSRAKNREDAYDNLMVSINVLANIAEFNHGFFDVINIANSLKINEKIK